MNEVVLLTGALGTVGRTILSHLSDSYTWRLLDNQPPDSDFPYDIITADIYAPEFPKNTKFFQL